MKTLTKKQRREIYLKVSQDVERRRGLGLCHLLMPEMWGWQAVPVLFPEFMLFKPNKIEDELNNRWWDNNDDGSRIICMLLCAEMCKP